MNEWDHIATIDQHELDTVTDDGLVSVARRHGYVELSAWDGGHGDEPVRLTREEALGVAEKLLLVASELPAEES